LGVEAGWRFGCLEPFSFGGRQRGHFRPSEGLEELVRAPLHSRSGLDSRGVGEECRKRGRRLYLICSLSSFAPSSARLHCFHEFLQVSFGVAMGFLFGWLVQPLWFSLGGTLISVLVPPAFVSIVAVAIVAVAAVIAFTPALGLVDALAVRGSFGALVRLNVVLEPRL
jgi:hypothetical protein